MLAPRLGLNGNDPLFSSTDAVRLFNWRDKYFSVADFSRLGGFNYGFNRFVNHIRRNANIQHDFRQQLHGIFAPAVDFGVPLLPSESFDLGDRHALYADVG